MKHYYIALIIYNIKFQNLDFLFSAKTRASYATGYIPFPPSVRHHVLTASILTIRVHRGGEGRVYPPWRKILLTPLENFGQYVVKKPKFLSPPLADRTLHMYDSYPRPFSIHYLSNNNRLFTWPYTLHQTVRIKFHFTKWKYRDIIKLGMYLEKNNLEKIYKLL